MTQARKGQVSLDPHLGHLRQRFWPQRHQHHLLGFEWLLCQSDLGPKHLVRVVGAHVSVVLRADCALFYFPPTVFWEIRHAIFIDFLPIRDRYLGALHGWVNATAAWSNRSIFIDAAPITNFERMVVWVDGVNRLALISARDFLSRDRPKDFSNWVFAGSKPWFVVFLVLAKILRDSNMFWSFWQELVKVSQLTLLDDFSATPIDLVDVVAHLAVKLLVATWLVLRWTSLWAVLISSQINPLLKGLQVEHFVLGLQLISFHFLLDSL